MANNLLATLFIMTWHTTLPLVPVFAASKGATPLLVGLIVASNVALPLVLALSLGAAADRFGTTWLARRAGAIFVVSYLLVLWSPTLGVLALGLAGVGLADVGLVIATQTYTAVTSTPANRDRNFAHLTIWISLGALIGPVLGGFFAEQWGYRVAFGGSLALAALTLMVTLVLPEPARVAESTIGIGGPVGRTRTLRDAATLARDPGVTFVLIANAAMMFATSVRQSFFPLYLHSVGISTTLIGVIFSLNSLSQMAIRPALSAVVQRLRYVGVLTLALCCTVAGLVVTPSLTSFWTLAAAFCVVGIGNGFMQPLTMSLISGRATPDMRGLAIGLRMTVNQLAQVIGPPFFGVVVGALSLGAAFHVAAGAAALGFASLARFARVAPMPVVAPAIEPTAEPGVAATRRVAGPRTAQHGEGHHAGTDAQRPESVLGSPGS
jgi:MFS family permease